MKMRIIWFVWFILQVDRGMSIEICPKICICRSVDIHTDCRYNSLTKLPEGIYPQVLQLDLSHNLFERIPENLSNFQQMEHLDLSHNNIKHIDVTNFIGVKALKVLDLSYNMFTEWMDINRDALSVVTSLKELNLSYNNLRGFPDIMEHPLNNNSLETLSLVNCSITNLLGDILAGLYNLKNLSLAYNPLMALNTQMKSRKLRTLDLTQCSLQRIHPDAFVQLSSLEVLILSRNYQLKKFSSKSSSLKVLDLSHCNLESIPTTSLGNLTNLNFQGNRVRHISFNSFSQFPFIHSLDLSNNAIVTIDIKAFHDLKVVQSIDLSFNKISSIDYKAFIHNTKLYNLDLSRNYLTDVGHLVISSLKRLDLSVCEIRELKIDSLAFMPKLQSLNLSRNLLTQLPNELEADDLRSLDLSKCWIYYLNNLTFSAMSRLSHLNLNGNRLMSVKANFFHAIRKVELNDNAWLCDCGSQDFKELHHWLYNFMSISDLQCRHPENVAGLTWESACSEAWNVADTGNSNTMGLYSISLVIFIAAVCIIAVYIHQAHRRKIARDDEQQEQDREVDRNQNRCLIHSNLRGSIESINRNAPDPRELQTPPSYAEAVSMPRLNASCNSLVGSHRSLHSLHSVQSDTSTRRPKLRRKRRRRRRGNKPQGPEDTQSAESLSHRRVEDSSSEDQISSQRTGRIHFIESSL